jgi:hypothetical protein
VLTNSGSSAQTFAGAGLTYYNVVVQGSGNYQLTVTGSNTFEDFTVNADEAAKTVKFTDGTTQTVGDTLEFAGYSGKSVTVTKTGAGADPIIKTMDYIGYSNSYVTVTDVMIKPMRITLTVGGTELVSPVFTLTADSTLSDTTVEIENEAAGETITWEGSLVNTDVLEIDCSTGIVKLNGSEDMSDVSGQFPHLIPDTNILNVSGFSGSMNIAYRARYV